MNVITGFFTIYFVTVVQGDKCCSPNQWEAFQYGSGDFLRPNSLESYYFSYDSDRKIFAKTGDYIKDGVKTVYKIIDDHKENLVYEIEPDNRICKVLTTQRDFPAFCVPDDARVAQTSYVGLGDNTLDVTGYLFPYKRGLFDTYAFVVATTADCIPVSLDLRGSYNNTPVREILNYIGITKGIKDPSVFTPPSYCVKPSEGFTDAKFPQENKIWKI